MPYRRPNVRVQLAGEFWAEISQRLRLGDDEEMARLRNAGEEDRIARVLIHRHLSAWNVTGDDGQVLPINEETVLQLYDDDVMALIETINGLRKSRTQAEQAGFTEESTPGLRADPIDSPNPSNGSEPNSSSPAI